MRVGEFFAWADALPELQRQETLQAINTRVIAGQRSVKDEDYKQAMRGLGKRVRRLEKRMTPEEFKAFEAQVEMLNRLWRQRKG